MNKDPYDDPVVLDMMRDYYIGADDTEEARAAAVREMAIAYGKTPSSIRGKLGALGVYKPKVIAKPGNVITKDKLADKIAKIALEEYGVNFSDGEIESIAKCNKTALKKFLKMIEIIEF